jgi:hypothetical protein
MAPQGFAGGQGTHTNVRRTVDRVDERYDERSANRIRTPDGLKRVSEPLITAYGFLPVYP